MSHEVESMVYYGEVPWHGLGVPVDHALTAEEAITLSGLDWEVELHPIYTENRKPVAGYQVLQRVTDNRVYNIVKNRYRPIQNKEAFNFFDDVVGAGQGIYHTAGSLKEGARIWILAKLKDSIGIKGDEVEKYICLSNSHDGVAALQMYNTPIRVVCANTLAMAESRAVNKFYTRHTVNYKVRMDVAREVLGMADTFYARWKEQAEYLANHMLPAGTMPLLLKASFGYKPEDIVGDIWAPVQREMAKVEALFAGKGKGLNDPAIRGTKWGAFNAVAEHIDHERIPKGNRPGARLNQAWFGSGAKTKRRAWDYLLKD